MPDLLAVDVGSSRVKFGWFPSEFACTNAPPETLLPIATPHIPEPVETFACQHRGVPVDEVNRSMAEWLAQFDLPQCQVMMASVNPAAATLVGALFAQLAYPAPHVLTSNGLRLDLKVKVPHCVGIDRLLNAVAVNRIRLAEHSAIVMDLGTAVTVDLVDENGSFQGGAILPGWSLAAAALHDAASSLPGLLSHDLQLPEQGIGKNTEEAIASGITWGLVGALEKLIAKFSQAFPGKTQLMITGGDAPLVLDALVEAVGPVRHLPHLVLAGIALAREGSR